MPTRRRVWTTGQDAIIIAGRAAGKTYAEIGRFLRINPVTVSERGRAINAPGRTIRQAPEPRSAEAYPAGHPATWGAIMPGYAWPGDCR